MERGRRVGSLFPQLRQLTKLEVISEWEVHAGSFAHPVLSSIQTELQVGFPVLQKDTRSHSNHFTEDSFGRPEEGGPFISPSQQAMLTVSCDHYTLPCSCLVDSSLFPSRSLLPAPYRLKISFLPTIPITAPASTPRKHIINFPIVFGK